MEFLFKKFWIKIHLKSVPNYLIHIKICIDGYDRLWMKFELHPKPFEQNPILFAIACAICVYQILHQHYQRGHFGFCNSTIKIIKLRDLKKAPQACDRTLWSLIIFFKSIWRRAPPALDLLMNRVDAQYSEDENKGWKKRRPLWKL